MKKVVILCSLILRFTTLLLAQTPPDTLWTKTYGGSDYDVASSVQQTSDGGYIVAGVTKSYGAGNSDFWLIKTDENGNEEWNQTYGGSDYDLASSVQQTSDGGYIVAGYTKSYGAGNSDFWLIKTDENGNEEWNQTYGGSDYDVAYSVQQTSDGGYIVAGYTKSYGAGNWDFWLIKTDENGNEEWNQTYGGSNDDEAYSVQQTSDGGYIVAGYTKSYGAGNSDFWLIKTDENGNEEWNQTYGGSDYEDAGSVQQTSDGGYIVAGFTQSYGAGSSDFWLVKTDENGNQQWNQTYGGSNIDQAYSVQQTSDEGYIAAGTESYGAGDWDFWLVKTDAQGNEEWNQAYGGSNDDRAYSVQQTSDGGYIVAGHTGSYGTGYWDFWMVRLAPGYSVDDFSSATSYNLTKRPNPCYVNENTEITISYIIPKPCRIKIEIYNIRGELVKTLINDYQNAGEHELTWNGKTENGDKVSSGVYLYKLETENKKICKKMLLMR